MRYGKIITCLICAVLFTSLTFPDQQNRGTMQIKEQVKREHLSTDLFINSFSITNKKKRSVIAGQKLNFICTWQRDGFDPKKSYTVTARVGNTELAGKTTDTSKKTDDLYFSWTALPGEHTVMCEVDSKKEVTESDEKNNKWAIQVKAVKIKLKITEKFKPDLIVTKVSYKPLPLLPCERVGRMVATIKNDSPVNCSTPFINAVSIQGVLAAEIEIDSLAAGEEKEIYYDWYIIKGSYIRIVTDFHDDVAESNEENNRLVTYADCN